MSAVEFISSHLISVVVVLTVVILVAWMLFSRTPGCANESRYFEKLTASVPSAGAPVSASAAAPAASSSAPAASAAASAAFNDAASQFMPALQIVDNELMNATTGMSYDKGAVMQNLRVAQDYFNSMERAMADIDKSTPQQFAIYNGRLQQYKMNLASQVIKAALLGMPVSKLNASILKILFLDNLKQTLDGKPLPKKYGELVTVSGISPVELDAVRDTATYVSFVMRSSSAAAKTISSALGVPATA